MKGLRIGFVLFSSTLMLVLLLQLVTAVSAVNITVNSNLDTADPTPADGVCDVDLGTSGNQCTLRAAIQTAQGGGGEDKIQFSNSMDIALSSKLPILSEDGLTIEANAGQVVRIDGQSTVNNIFQIHGSNVTISNMVIYGSNASYSNIWVDDAVEGVVIANNLIGDDDPAPGGCGQNDDAYGGIYVGGATSPPMETYRVWIYGNIIECHVSATGEGVTFFATDSVFLGTPPGEEAPLASGNIIRHNKIGVINYGSETIIVSGNTIENNVDYGIVGYTHGRFFVIGCFISNREEPETCRNMIRGNGEAGIYMLGANSHPAILWQNWIGLADDGVTAVPNKYGVYLHTDNHETVVFSNTISGNLEDGIRIRESNGEHSFLGNVIGLGADGETAVANGSHGIAIFDDAGENTIGSEEAESGNIVSGNNGFGIFVSNTPTITIGSNLIGLAQDEFTERGNGYNGIYAEDSTNLRIGMPVSGEISGSVKIVANGEAGIYLSNVQNTSIGPATEVIDNNGAGIYIYNSQDNLIFPHLVSGNDGAGIQLSGNLAHYNQIIPLLVKDNSGLPIDFGLPGLEPNDPGDTDNGPNHMLNYPEVTMTSGTVITGTACPSCTILVYEAIGDPTENGGGGNVNFGSTLSAVSDGMGVWSVDLAAAGLQWRPVSFVAFSEFPGSTHADSSPMSPVIQLGYALYLPMIVR